MTTPTPSLDEKLREIEIELPGYDKPTHLKEQEIAQIKQAFAEAGYMTFKEIESHTPGKCMTGQEWCKRFAEELKKINATLPQAIDGITALRAVEVAMNRAAGLTDGN